MENYLRGFQNTPGGRWANLVIANKYDLKAMKVDYITSLAKETADLLTKKDPFR